MQRVVILGAGYAGLMTALRLAGQVEAGAVQITLLSASDVFIERIRQHQLAVQQYQRSYALSKLLQGRAIDFTQGVVSALDPVAQTVHFHAQGQSRNIAYDTLVYALGSCTDRSGLPGLDEHAFRLEAHGPRSATQLAQQLAARADHPARVLVIGGGLSGIEAAAEIAEAYPQFQVALVTRGELGTGLSAGGQAHIKRVFDRLGVVLHEHTIVTSLETDNAQLDDGQALPFDVCVWAGAMTVPRLAREAGIKVDQRGRIVTDDRLRSLSHPTIFAVGDAGVQAEQPLRMACAGALPLGAHAADNLARSLRGQPEAAFAFRYLAQCISLGRRDALIQWVDQADRPTERIMTGRLGILAKEILCRYTIWVIKLTRWLPRSYYFPKPKQIKASGAASSVHQQAREEHSS